MVRGTSNREPRPSSPSDTDRGAATWLTRLWTAASAPPLVDREAPDAPRAWWALQPAANTASDDPLVVGAILAAASADRVAWATLAGHQHAICRVLGRRPGSDLYAMCATEDRGAHPRTIKTSLTAAPHADGTGLVLDGEKRWATLAPAADWLVVLATEGWVFGRNQLRLAVVPTDRSGIDITPMDSDSRDSDSDHAVQPEIEHAIITLDGVEVQTEEVWDGDGWLAGVKPFRLIEDLYIAAALLAYTLRRAVEFEWPEEAHEELLHLLVAAVALADCDPHAASTHLAVAGFDRAVAATRRDHEQHWARVAEPVRLAWQRDTGRTIAARARELRRQASWQKLRPAAAIEV